jgi:hypothetical protein
LIKSEKKVFFRNKPDKIHTNTVGIISVKGDEFNFLFEGDYEQCKSLDEKSWIVIKNMYTTDKEGYRLREGDVIKLGKVMFKVREMKNDGTGSKLKNKKKSEKTMALDMHCISDKQGEANVNFNTNIHLNLNNNLNTKTISKDCQFAKKETQKGFLPVCRICLMDENENDNPLINPCNCIGSVRFIHLLCIKQWLKSKVNTKSFNFLTVHSFKTFECEICKSAIPGITLFI